MALSAFCPVTATFRSPMGGRRALPGPLLSAVGTGHWAIAPRAPLLPLSVHWGANRNPTSVEKDGRQNGEMGVVSYLLFSFSEHNRFALTMTVEQSKHVHKTNKQAKKVPHYHVSAYHSLVSQQTLTKVFWTEPVCEHSHKYTTSPKFTVSERWLKHLHGNWWGAKSSERVNVCVWHQ